MRTLRLVAVSEDGSHLILSDGGDDQLALQVDERLHAAIRGDRARLGQLEIQLESQLRPRDIQARIRAGESVESVAAVAGMPLDKVRRFAGPVIAEREHIADRARQATMRRVHGDAPVRTLDAAASAAASAAGVDADAIEWDAWRRDDGRWQVRCTWAVGDADASALFSFDPSGRSVVAEDDSARVLAGELRVDELEPADAPEPPAGPARLSVVESPADDLEALSDAVRPAARPAGPADTADTPIRELVRPIPDDDDTAPDLPVDHATEQLTGPVSSARRARRPGRPERRRRDTELWSDDSGGGADDTLDPDDDATSDRLRLSDIASRVEVDDAAASAGSGTAAETTVETEAVSPDEPDEPAQPEAPVVRKTASGSRSRRPSVPSWDEIMFGRRKTD